jgi:hypothetical protein
MTQKNGYSLLCIILGLALLAPNFAFSENDDEDEDSVEQTASEPAPSSVRSSRCDLSHFQVDVEEHFSLSQDSVAKSFQAETGIAFYHLKKSFLYAGAGYSYNLVKVTREEEKTRFTRRVINLLKAYPKEFILKLDRVCFVLIDSFYNDSGTAGLTPGATVILPTNAVNSTINHELMHAVDYSYPFTMRESAAWHKANKTYSYVAGSTGAFSGSRYSALSKAFITNYAKASELEDKAELVAAMAYNHKELLNKISDKTIITNKLKLLKQKLTSIDSSLTEDYWTNRQIDFVDGSYERCARIVSDSKDCTANSNLTPHPSWN